MKKLLLSVGAAVLAVGAVAQNVAPPSPILLKNQTLRPEKADFQGFDISENETVNGHFYRILQKENLTLGKEAAGILPLEYLPKNSFIARIAISEKRKAEKFLGDKAVVLKIQPEWKLSPRLFHQDIPEWAGLGGNQFKLWVHCFDEISVGEAARSLGVSILENDESQNRFAVSATLADVQRIARFPFVKYLQEMEDPGTPENYTARSNHRVNFLQGKYPGAPGYDGAGVTVGHGDDGEIGPHIDFAGRLTQNANPSNGDHGDHVAGTIFGAGNLDPTGKGMAPGAEIYYQSYPSNLHSADGNYITQNVRITASSYSNGCNAGYTSFTRQMDQDAIDNPELIHVFSAGNSGGSNCGYGSPNSVSGWGNVTGGHKIAKNAIATANLTRTDGLSGSSSRGPASDGRIKPDLGAVGSSVFSTTDPNSYTLKSGTSMACPGVAGVLATLYQAYKNQNAAQNPHGGLMKAILMNTAEDLGNPGPDFKYGYGRINAKRAAEAIENQNYITGTISGGTQNFTLPAPPIGANVRVMLYWPDLPASTSAARALVNDLDLDVSHGGISYDPWVLDPTANVANLDANAVRARDSLNNAEQVTYTATAGGAVSVSVSAFNIPSGSQQFFIVYYYEKNEVALTYPIGGEEFVPGTSEYLRWDALGNTGTFSLEYSTDGSATWNFIATKSGGERYHIWTVPSALSGNARVRVTRSGQSSASLGDFTILPTPSNFQFTKICGDTVSLSWNAVSGATGYNVYRLGAKYMDSVGFSTTTDFTEIFSTTSTDVWYAVAAVINGKAGRRTLAKQRTNGSINCGQPCLTAISSFPYSESFESGLGDWFQGFGDDFDWTTNSGGTPSTATGPSAAAAGSQYVYMEASSPNYPSRTAILESPCFDLTGKIGALFNFQYHTYGVNMGTLTLEVAVGKNPWQPVWSTTGDQGDQWFPVSLNLDTLLGLKVRFRFSGITGSSYQSDMAVDDLQLIVAKPFCAAPISSFPYNEGFESGLGDWSQVAAGDDFDWSRNSGGTPSIATGPTAASEGNFYLYTEASFANHPAKTAILNGPCFDLVGHSSAQFVFDYNMYGAQMGVLELQATTDGLTYATVWSKSGDQGTAWQTATVDLAAYLGDTVQLRYVGTTANHWESDMSVDNLELSTSTTACANPGSLPHSEGFENTIGSWTQDANDDYDWIPYNGYTPTNRTGPKVPVDGTHYLYVEADKPNSPNKTGIIYSPCFDLSNVPAASFDFSYFMHGHFRMGSITLEGSSDGVTYDSLWSISGKQIAVWHSASVPLDSFVGGDLTLRFRAVTGTHRRGDMAIDAVNLTIGATAEDEPFDRVQTPEDSVVARSEYLALFPNPTNGNATLLHESLSEKRGQIHVFSLNGKRLWQKEWHLINGKNRLEIPAGEWPAGTYLVRFQSGEELEVLKLQVR